MFVLWGSNMAKIWILRQTLWTCNSDDVMGNTELTSVAVCFYTCSPLGLYEDRFVNSVKSSRLHPPLTVTHATFVCLFWRFHFILDADKRQRLYLLVVSCCSNAPKPYDAWPAMKWYKKKEKKKKKDKWNGLNWKLRKTKEHSSWNSWHQNIFCCVCCCVCLSGGLMEGSEGGTAGGSVYRKQTPC